MPYAGAPAGGVAVHPKGNSVRLTIKRWEALRGGDLTGLPPASVAVLPVGAVEHHGPHLPLGTDAMILDGVLEALDVPPDAGSEAWAVILPVQRIGWSVEHRDWPGTLSRSPDRLVADWVELGGWVARAGFRRLLILNSHGGNAALTEVTTMRLRAELGLLAARVHWQDLAGPSNPELARDWHGGHIETSVMLHLRPDLVHMGAARPPAPRHPPELPPDGMAAWSWMSGDLDPGGVIGDPSGASAVYGAELVGRAAEGLRELLIRLASAPWPH